jgi:hypothetical protein
MILGCHDISDLLMAQDSNGYATGVQRGLQQQCWHPLPGRPPSQDSVHSRMQARPLQSHIAQPHAFAWHLPTDWAPTP